MFGHTTRSGRPAAARRLHRAAAATAVGAVLASGLVAAQPGAPRAEAATTWTTLTATPADAFVGTVGVNVHTNYTDTVYQDQDRTLRLLRELGVRHVRDAVKHDNKPMHAALRRLRDNGIKTSVIVDPAGRYGAGTLQQQIAALKDPARLGGVADLIEGPNELDCGSGWETTTRDQQKRLSAALAVEPTLRDIPLLGPSWCRGVRSVKAYGSDGTASDAWNLHPYPGGWMPEAEVGGQLGPEQGIRGQIDVATSVERQPVYATETGYHNAVNGDGRGHNPTSEKASGPYAARLSLEYARLGVKRGFFYELSNERPETALVDREQHFGLARYDGSTKPAYRHLQSLLRTLADPGTAVPARQVQVGLEGAPSNLRTMAFARRDGSTDLVMWRAQSLWDVAAKKDLVVPAVDVRLSTRTSTTASAVRTATGLTRTSLGSGTSFGVRVDGSPVIVRLGSASTAPAPTPTPTPTPIPAAPAVTAVSFGAKAQVVDGAVCWFTDTGVRGGTAATPRVAITGASVASREAYKSLRWGMTSYARTLPSGTYDVRFLMSEDTFTAAGRRVFSVTAEGRRVLADVDIFAAVGRGRPLERTVRVTVTDGRLDLGFTATRDNPVLNGVVATRVG